MATDFMNFRPGMFCWNISKVSPNGSHIEKLNVAIDGKGNPAIPANCNEREIGRWHMYDGSKPSGEIEVLQDSEGRGVENPDVGSVLPTTVYTGDFKCLVTNKALRFTGTDGTIPGFGRVSYNLALAFTLPFDSISEIRPGTASMFSVTPLILFSAEWQATMALIHATRANAKFDSSFLARNHLHDFTEQVRTAHATAIAAS